MRLAFYSPLNPIATGIADYSLELLPLLARAFEIELVVDDDWPSNPALAGFRVRTRAELKRDAASYDVVLYHMGNSPAHAQIYETLLEIPGVVVMHDLVLHHLRAWQTLERGDVVGYVTAMRADYGEAGAELARLEALGLANLDRFDYPLNGEVARAARALIVHSRYAADEFARRAPQTPVAIVPMGVPPGAAIDRLPARDKLGLPRDAFIVAAFGEVHPYKRVTVALDAFAEFHRHLSNALLLLVGRESEEYDTAGLVRLFKLGESVRRVGFAPREDYENYIAAADVCLNLRYPTAGETSASLLRLFAAGKAVIVTRTGAYAELPAGVCAKIEADEFEHDLLVAHLDLLAARPDLVRELGENARSFVARGHTLEQSAAAYIDFLQAVAEKRAVSKSYLVDGRPGGAGSEARNGRREEAGREMKGEETSEPPIILQPQPAVDALTLPDTLAAPPAPNPAPPGRSEPSSAGSPLSPRASSLLDSVALDYAALGLDADDPILQSVARALVELGLAGEERSA